MYQTMNKKHLAISVVVAFFVMVLAANLTLLNGPRIASSNQGPSVAGLETRQSVAPNFSLRDTEGEFVSLDQFTGNKPVILDFFATWSENCQRNVPSLSNFAEVYSDQLQVLGISIGETKVEVSDFGSEYGITFPLLLDTDNSVASQYNVQFTNYHVLINKDGTIFGTVSGDITIEHIEQLIDANN